MADRWQPQGGPSPADELFQAVEELKRKARRFSGGKGLWIIPIALVLLWLATGFYVVGPGERGVELLFGAVSSETESGLRWRWPWPVQSHAVVDIASVRRAEVGFRTAGDIAARQIGRQVARGGARTIPAEALMLTRDQNIVELQFFVQYRVQDPVKFLFHASEPEEILHSAAEVALRSAVGLNTIDYTMTEGRLEVQTKARSDLQEMLNTYQTGLLVTAARLLVVDPPSEVRDAFHDVVRALEDRDRLMQQAEGYREDVIPKARGQAAQMVQQAEAYKARRVLRAQGDAARFLQVLAEYQKAKDVTRDRLYLESVERIMPGVEKYILDSTNSGGVLPLLPLKDLSSAASAGTQPTNPTPDQDGR